MLLGGGVKAGCDSGAKDGSGSLNKAGASNAEAGSGGAAGVGAEKGCALGVAGTSNGLTAGSETVLTGIRRRMMPDNHWLAGRRRVDLAWPSYIENAVFIWHSYSSSPCLCQRRALSTMAEKS